MAKNKQKRHFFEQKVFLKKTVKIAKNKKRQIFIFNFLVDFYNLPCYIENVRKVGCSKCQI